MTYGNMHFTRVDGRCMMPTDSARICRRPSRYVYIDGAGEVVAAYCSQHERADGHSLILRPRPWEFLCKMDAAAGVHVDNVPEACRGWRNHRIAMDRAGIGGAR